ncbi:MAG: hypothetical protein AAB627_01250 [Patescibacteria group bacterium]
MKYFVLYTENVSITEMDDFVWRHTEIEADSDESVIPKVRNLKNPDTRIHRIIAIDHDLPIPSFV